jgi:hypothetical protein
MVLPIACSIPIIKFSFNALPGKDTSIKSMHQNREEAAILESIKNDELILKPRFTVCQIANPSGLHILAGLGTMVQISTEMLRPWKKKEEYRGFHRCISSPLLPRLQSGAHNEIARNYGRPQTSTRGRVSNPAVRISVTNITEIM